MDWIGSTLGGSDVGCTAALLSLFDRSISCDNNSWYSSCQTSLCFGCSSLVSPIVFEQVEVEDGLCVADMVQ